MKCRFCNHKIELLLDMEHIPISVTSDCQIMGVGFKVYICTYCNLIQKSSNESSQKNLFDSFHSHLLKDGEEQLKFIDGKPYPRSKLIIDAIIQHINVNGKLLDIGTGSGSFLKSCQNQLPEYELFGQDIQSNSKDKVLQIISEDKFFFGELSEIRMKFDLLSLVHVLGHIPHLDSFMINLCNLLEKDGTLIVQTPDLEKNFFDIVILDQINHFTKNTLYTIFKNYFKNIHFVSSVEKEITLIANHSKQSNVIHYETVNYRILANQFKQFIEYLKGNTSKFIVFGCAPVSTYIGAVLDERLVCFIDEDESLIGEKHLGKPILHPLSIDFKYDVVLPFFDKNINTRITVKYCKLNFITIESVDKMFQTGKI